MSDENITTWPNGWSKIFYSDAVLNITTNGKKINQKKYLESGRFPVIDQGQSGIGGYTNDPNIIIECDFPVIVFGDHTKIVKFIREPFATGADGVKVLQPQKFIKPRLLEYFTRYLSISIKDKGYARHYQWIAKEYIGIPPENEQHRIVAKIEQLFSELDKGIENLKKARAQLKVYRQAVLKHAFEGKLTEQWRKDNADDVQGSTSVASAGRGGATKLETAEQLLTRIQKKREIYLKKQIEKGNAEAKRFFKKTSKNPQDYPNISLPHGAIWVNFLDLCTFVVDCHNKTAPYQKNGIYLIRTPCVRGGKIHLNEDARFISEATYEYWSRRCPPEPGDIILTREAPMGEAGIVPSDEKICMGQRMMLLRPPASIDSKYILYSIMEPLFQSRLDKASIGTGVKHLRVGDVERFCIPFFPLREQKEIVSIVESILSVIEKQERDLDILFKQSETLRQSILKKAFSGQLVEQDPNDEPAAVLLERIKAEKEKQKTSAAKKKSTSKRKSAA